MTPLPARISLGGPWAYLVGAALDGDVPRVDIKGNDPEAVVILKNVVGGFGEGFDRVDDSWVGERS